MEPVKDILLKEDAPFGMGDFLDRIMDVQIAHYDSMVNQVSHTVDVSKNLFSELDPQDAEKLSIFTTAYLLTIQATAQKHMATQLIDNYLKPDKPEPTKKTEKTKKG